MAGERALCELNYDHRIHQAPGYHWALRLLYITKTSLIIRKQGRLNMAKQPEDQPTAK